MPVHHFVDDRSCVERGLRNYWGYNSIGYFAPDARYAATATRAAGARVQGDGARRSTRAGIEVILDVVYNHTAEGNHLGPTLSLRGIDNAVLLPAGARRPALLHGLHRHRQQLDLHAPARPEADHGQPALLGAGDARGRLPLRPRVGARRASCTTSTGCGFFDIIHQDPLLSQDKLIAEPWDIGPGGYQVGNFPVLWAEWNGKYRDTMRKFWKGDAGRGRASPPLDRVAATCTSRTAAARRQHQLHHGARRLHPARPGHLQREAQRGQRRGTTRTATTTTARGTAASRGRPTSQRSTRCASASSATSSRRCCSRRACRCCSAGTSSAAPSTATTTPSARTTRSAGSTGTTTSRPSSLLAFASGSSSCGASTRSSAGAPS